jgi:competence protein ComEA
MGLAPNGVADLPTGLPAHAEADLTTHRTVLRVPRGTGSAGRARHRSGVRPGGPAGVSPGTVSGGRQVRRRRILRGPDPEVAAASRLRADALMASDRSAGSTSTGTATVSGAALSRRPGRARAAPSWAVTPQALPTSTHSPEALPTQALPTPDVGSTAVPAAGPPRPLRDEAHAPPAARTRWWQEAGSALRDRLPLWVQLRCGLEPRALAALAVVLVGAAVLAATHFWSARPEPVRAPERVTEAAAVQAAGPGSAPARLPGAAPGPAPGLPTGAGPGGRIVVDVSGKVRRPGIRYLPAGSRVADALRAAGGVREGTDITGLNRARVLTDGEQVVVGLPGPPPPAGRPGAGGAGQAGPGAPVSLGTATVEQLETLPGVGPVLAQHIVDYRTEHGGYRSVDELREVNGIGDRRFADLRPLVSP